jgi:opacity protein-like surface antigen
MKKRVVFCLLFFTCFFVSSQQVMAEWRLPTFSVRLSGGLCNYNGGDFKTVLQSQELELKDEAALFGWSTKGNLEWKSTQFDMELELIFGLAKHLGIGLAIEYVKGGHDCWAEATAFNGDTTKLEFHPEFTVIPIHLNAYYYLPFTEKVTVFAKAGAGYYLTKLDFTFRETNDIGIVDTYSQSAGVLKDKNIGFQLASGVEFQLTKNITLFAEGRYRFVRLRSWESDVDLTDSSKNIITAIPELWYVEEFDYDTNKYYPEIGWQEEQPGDLIRNKRPAKADFNGWSLKFGIRVGIGK